LSPFVPKAGSSYNTPVRGGFPGVSISLPETALDSPECQESARNYFRNLSKCGVNVNSTLYDFHDSYIDSYDTLCFDSNCRNSIESSENQIKASCKGIASLNEPMQVTFKAIRNIYVLREAPVREVIQFRNFASLTNNTTSLYCDTRTNVNKVYSYIFNLKSCMSEILRHQFDCEPIAWVETIKKIDWPIKWKLDAHPRCIDKPHLLETYFSPDGCWTKMLNRSSGDDDASKELNKFLEQQRQHFNMLQLPSSSIGRDSARAGRLILFLFVSFFLLC
jgi:hypothetical protein